jgi:zinc protease
MMSPAQTVRIAANSLLLVTSTLVAMKAAEAVPAKRDAVVVREVGQLPDWKSLQFRPLNSVKIPQPQIFTLSNGLKVYLLENHELPLVSGRALVRTGNLFDPKEKRGLAEITGITLRSGGTSKLSGDEIDEQLEDMAAAIESGIGESEGTVGFSCLKANTDAVLELFHDIITQPAFRQDKIDLAKTQIKSSISRRNDDAGGIAQHELLRLVYGPDTPYGGEIEYDTINHVNRDDVAGFYKRYFFPSNIILSVYGDFDAAAMKSRLESLLGSWQNPQPKAPPFPKVDAPPAPGIYFVSKKDVTQTFIDMGHLGGELRDKDFAALSVAADVFGGGFSSRLFREVRTHLGYAYAVGAGWAANYDHPGLFRINVSTKSQSTTETIQAILKQLEEVRNKEITDDELKVAKDSVLNSLVFAFERPSSTLNRLVTYDYFGYPADFLTRYQHAVASVTKADVLRVAKQYFQPSQLTIVAVGNADNFNQPLTALNIPVKTLDVSIPQPHVQMANASTETIARGKELLNKALTFLGGREKLASLHDFSETETSQMESPQGDVTIKSFVQAVLPSTFRQEQERGPMKLILAFNAESGWVSSPQGQQDLPEAALTQMRAEAAHQFLALMSALSKNPGQPVATGAGTLQVTTASGDLVTLTVDPSSGEPKRLEYTRKGEQVQENFDDWRDIDGLKVPFKTEVSVDGKTVQKSITSEIKLNTNLNAENLNKKP